ncbi:MAG TPA: Fe-S cluster assembly protein SufD [Sphingomicrobium sp.]|nr:Fe-S cluster assembly protein SufD [Sphingomicrobium sp.]
MITASEQLGAYLDSFSKVEERAREGKPRWLHELRQGAFARFCQAGFPTTHQEDWRFTNVSALARTPFELAPGERISVEDVEPFRLSGALCQLVFVNGHFQKELSLLDRLPTGVRVTSLAREIDENPEGVRAHFARYLNIERDPFCALNTAFAEDGAYVEIRKGTVVEQPIALLFVSTAADKPLMSHPRNLIVAGGETQAAILEDYVSLGETTAFSNTATELVAGENAVISHYMIVREHGQAFNISTLRLEQGRSANVASHSVLLGGGLVRNNVHPVLAGEGGECLINGLFIGSGREHLDNYMLVEHRSAHSASRQFYNGILDGRAHGVFHGRIIVHKNAQKTDAKQTNRNLLLSDDARIDTKPQLEIYADDVKCTHGATIGQIEENALFYLRSRGIDELSARKLLLLAFAGECVDRMAAGVAREHVERLIHAYLIELALSPKLETSAGGEEQGRVWEETR